MAGFCVSAASSDKEAKSQANQTNYRAGKTPGRVHQGHKGIQTSLAKLVAIYEREVIKAEEKLTQSQDLFAQGLISKNQLAESETCRWRRQGQSRGNHTAAWQMPTRRLLTTLLEAQG